MNIIAVTVAVELFTADLHKGLTVSCKASLTFSRWKVSRFVLALRCLSIGCWRDG